MLLVNIFLNKNRSVIFKKQKSSVSILSSFITIAVLLIFSTSVLQDRDAVFAQTNNTDQTAGINFEFVTKWGSLGDEPGQFDGQNDVVGSGEAVYVGDYYNERLQKFTPEGEFILMWGGTYGDGDGEFQKPHGVAVDSEGNVYVSERSGLRIQKFDSDGNFISKWGSAGTGDGQFQHLHDIAVGTGGTDNQSSSSTNEFVYVTDAELFNVQKFTTDGQFVTKWGSEGTGEGQFGSLESIDVDSQGNVYVADSDNDRVQKFTSNGDFLLSWGSSGSEPGQFDEPGGVAVDNDDNVYITDINNHRVQVFSSDGQFITQIGLNQGDADNDSEIVTPSGSNAGACCTEGEADGQFNQPEGIDVDPQNRVIVADTGNNRIQVFQQN